MKRIIVVLGIFLLMVPIVRETHADRGMVPFMPHVKVFEPNQNAMIAWNGEEEILLLTTDLKASEKTKAIEVLPLPSEPQVRKGDPEVFKRAVKLINSKTRRPGLLLAKRRGTAGHAAPGPPPAGEVTFHDQIGSHDISVSHVLNKEGFVEWVEKYLKSAGVDNPEIPEGLKKVVGEYLDSGFTWFVFDVVELAETPGSTEAIQYRFATSSFFYPLKISTSLEGNSLVKLLALTHHHVVVKNDVGVKWIKPHPPIAVTSEEATEIDSDMAALFGKRKEMTLRIWEFTGSLASFKNDLVAESLKYSRSDELLDQATRTKSGRLLIEAAQQGDLSEVRKLLDLGINANWNAHSSNVASGFPRENIVGWIDETALLAAAWGGFADIVKLLLDSGADVNGRMRVSMITPLMRAARNGRVAVIRVLVRKKVDVNTQDSKGLTALHHAAEKGHEESVKLLLQNRADVNVKTSEGQTALQLAAERGHTGTVKLLQSYGPH